MERGQAGSGSAIGIGGAGALGMATAINLDEIGTYQGSSKDLYDSRYDAASSPNYTVSRTNAYWWHCQYLGHSDHVVLAVMVGSTLYADCDCYDFREYGRTFERACEHIWRIFRYEDVAEL